MEAIVLNKLQKIYDDGFKAVDDLSLAIKEGEILGLLGPNGAGKSTTIKILTGLHSATSGSFTILGKKMNGSYDVPPGMIGYVPQDLIVYDHLTVYENLKLFAASYGLANQDKKIQEMMDLLHLNEIKKKKAEKLSRGQKRRLNLALGILHQPKILILDEPSAGMDPQSRNILWESIRKISKEESITIILTTHLMESVDRLADRVAVIDHGKLIALGTTQELKNQFGSELVLEIVFSEEFDRITEVEQKLELQFEGCDFIPDKNKITIASSSIYELIGDIISKIDTEFGNGVIKSVQVHETTLEDVFIRLTGRALREEEL